MTRRGRRTRLASALLAGALVAACSAPGEDAAIEEDGGAAPTIAGSPVDLSTLALDATTVRELGEIGLTGVAEDADLTGVSFALRDGEVEVPLGATRGQDGLRVRIPLVPTSPGRGGDVEVVVSSGDEQVALPVVVTALPPAPGAWDEAVGRLRTHLAERAEAAGSSYGAVMSTDLDDLDGDLALVRLVGTMVDDGSGEDLESLLDDGATPLTEQERDLLDALVAAVDPTGVLVPTDRVLVDAGVVEAAGDLTLAAPARPSVGGPVLAATASCRSYPLEIDDAQALADAIAIGIDARVPEGGAVDTLYEDFGTLSFYTNEIPVLGSVMDALGAMAETSLLLHEADAGRYPSSIEALQATVTTDEFNEDFTEPGRVTEVAVRAESTGFDAAARVSTLATEVADAVLGEFVGELPGDWGSDLLVDLGARLRKPAVAAVLQELTERRNALRWCAQSWAVEITGPEWVDVVGVARLDTDDLNQTYEPNSVGDGMLRVRADPAAFSGATAHQELPVTITRLQVVATPDTIVVEDPGEPHDVTVTVTGADLPTLRWDAGPGRWMDDTGLETNSGGTRRYETPDEESAYPFTIAITSLSRKGLREGADDVRDDSVRFRLAGQELRVVPGTAFLAPGESLSFVALDENGAEAEVRWTATGGDVSASGTYTAGSTEGSYSVTATSTADPELVTTAPVTVRVVDGCEFRYEVVGSLSSEEGYNGPVARTVEFTWAAGADEPDTGTMNTRALGADGEITRILLNDLAPVQTILNWADPSGDIGAPAGLVPVGATGRFALPGAVAVASISEGFGAEFVGDFTVDVAVSTAEDGRRGLLAGTFTASGLEVRSPLGSYSGSVDVIGGEFVFDPSTC